MTDYGPPQLSDPATRAHPVTPSNQKNLPFVSRAISVNECGMVRLTTLDGDIVTLFIAAGCPFPIRAKKILANQTTAKGIHALA